MWTICLLRDPHIQTLLIHFLATRLVQLNKPTTIVPYSASGAVAGVGGGGASTGGGSVATIATSSGGGGGGGGSSSTGTTTTARYILPSEDPLVRLTTQLCGQALSTEFALCALDQELIHYSLPTIVLGKILILLPSSPLLLSSSPPPLPSSPRLSSLTNDVFSFPCKSLSQ